MIKYLLLSFGVSFMVVASVGQTSAASTQIKGITVSPAIEQLTLNPNQSTASFNEQVTNNTTSPVVLKINAEDFTYLNQNGGLDFYNSSTDTNSHGLLDFLSIGLNQIALGPGQSQAVPISILNANKLAVGGHYAALLFKIQGVPVTRGNQVVINQEVSSLIFLSTYGQGTQTTNLSTPLIGSVALTMPQAISAVFTNNGNTQTTPSGYAQVLNSASQVISQGQINTGSGLILPGSKRLFTFNLIQTKKRVWPGVYTLKVYYHHDGQASYSVYQQKFLFVNGTIVTIVVVVIIALSLLLMRAFLPKTFYSVERQP
jgi:hypothetical protein